MTNPFGQNTIPPQRRWVHLWIRLYHSHWQRSLFVWRRILPGLFLNIITNILKSEDIFQAGEAESPHWLVCRHRYPYTHDPDRFGEMPSIFSACSTSILGTNTAELCCLRRTSLRWHRSCLLFRHPSLPTGIC